MTRARNLALAAGVLGALVAGCSSGGTLAPVASPTASATATTDPATASAEPTASPGGGGGGGPVGVTSDPPAPAPASTDPANCAASELKGSFADGDAGAGHVYETIVLTNVGKRTCALRGFPGVSYVTGDDGHQVGPAAEMSGPRGNGVSIAPGRAVGAVLDKVQVAAFDAAACKPVATRGLRIYPPGDTASLFLPQAGTGCSGSNIPGHQLSVQAVKAR